MLRRITYGVYTVGDVLFQEIQVAQASGIFCKALYTRIARSYLFECLASILQDLLVEGESQQSTGRSELRLEAIVFGCDLHLGSLIETIKVSNG